MLKRGCVPLDSYIAMNTLIMNNYNLSTFSVLRVIDHGPSTELMAHGQSLLLITDLDQDPGGCASLQPFS